MRKYLSTGLVILLPLVLTLLILTFLINFMTKPFLGVTENILIYLFNSPDFLLNHPGFVIFSSKLLILITLFFTALILGIVARFFFIDYLFRIGNKIVEQVPVISQIYKGCQDVVSTLFSASSSSFSQVVFVPFPTPNTLSIGLVTRDEILIRTHQKASSLVPVFVPGTPNPSVGFLLMFKKEQLIFVNMTVEEAMKFVVSCGVVLSEFIISESTKVLNEKVNEPE